MKLTTFVLSAAAIYSANVVSRPVRRDVDPNLVPQFGIQSGVNPTGTGDCDGITGSDGKPIKIPCACPPSRDEFLQSLNANVAAGHVINNPTVQLSFPTDSSKGSQSARLNAAAVTLQNLHGPGKGCPVAATTFSAQQKAIDALPNGSTVIANPPAAASPIAASPASSSPAVSPSPSPVNNAAGTPSAAQIAALAPPLGFQSGVNPTGTGDCDGAVNGSDGKPIKIPCACPPSQDVYVQSLIANVQAGHAVNNTVVSVSFPIDNSKNSQSARLTAASITLQNLNGPGKGCPVVSTTFNAQQQAINALPNGSTQVATAPSGVPAVSSPVASTVASSVGSAPAASSPVATAPAKSNNAASTPSAAQIAVLAPSLGFQSGVNPTGTGDCDGAVTGSDGKPIKIPCACPPSQDVYVQSLIANVQAGHAINNTVVSVSFPTDNSKNSQSARLTAASITLQNLNGPGKGCPVAATTFSAQQKAINALPDGSTELASAPSAAVSDAPCSTSIVTVTVTPSAISSAVSSPVATTPAKSNNAATNSPSAAQIAALAPPLGFQSGVNPTGTGDCDGAVNGSDGKPIKIPCACPPSQDVYIQSLIANVQAGHAVNNTGVSVSFPVDNSKNSQSARLTAASITLQNLNGPGKGCPVVSTTFSAQQKAIDALSNGSTVIATAPSAAVPAPSSAAASSSPAASPVATSPANSNNAASTPSAAQITALAPALGFQSGLNPTGTGDCDGAVNGADGKPIKIPCACPPPQDEYISQLVANVQASHAINNPTVGVSFPVDNSKASQSARITAALITLQNLNGPGKGCPAVSTTLLAQQKALQ